MNKTTIGSSLIFVAEHCAWPLHRYDEKHPLSHSMICGLVVSFFDKCFKFQNTHPAKFAFVLCISSSKSNCLLNFKYRFIWLSIRGDGGEGMFRKWSKMRWKWRSVARFDCHRWEPGGDGTIWLFTEVMNPAKNASNSTLDRIMFG